MSQVYLCSHPPFDCTTIHPTRPAILEHLSASSAHPRTATYRLAYGLTAFHALVLEATLHPPATTVEGTPIYHCPHCSVFFITQASALSHWAASHAETTTHILDTSGEEGLRAWLYANHARVLLIASPASVAPAPVLIGPREVSTTAHYFNGDLRNVIPLLLPSPSILLTSKYRKQNIDPTPAPPLMVHFRAPLAIVDEEVAMTASTLRGFAALLKHAYARARDAEEAESVDWEGMLRAGMQVRCDTKDGGARGVVVSGDEDVGRMRDEMVFGEGWLGVCRGKDSSGGSS